MADPSKRPSVGQGDPKRPKTTSEALVLKPEKLGTRGSPVNVRANYFVLTKLPTQSPQLYGVEITSLRLQRDENREIIKDENGNALWEKERVVVPPTSATNRKIIARLVHLYKDTDFKGRLPGYDGRKLLYALERLEFEEKGETAKEFLVGFDEERGANGRVTVQEKRFLVEVSRPVDNEINLDLLRRALAGQIRTVPQNAVSALETVLKDRPSTMLKVVGQSFFDPNQRPFDLGGGVDGWVGFYQSLKAIQLAPKMQGRSQQGALALNVDTAVAAFLKPVSVIQRVADTLRTSVEQLRHRPPLNPADLQKVEKALKGLTVEVTHMGEKKRKLRVQKISLQPVGDIEFEWTREGSEPRMCTVPQYFHEQYGQDLQFPHLPAFMSGREMRTATPFEVCVIVKGTRVKKLTDFQTSAMIKKAAQPPGQRRAQTEQIVLANKYNEDPLIREWGLVVSPQMMRIQARVLPAPELMYRNGTVRNRPGKWNLTPPGRALFQMYKSQPIDSWALLNLAAGDQRSPVHEQRAWAFAQQLIREGQNFGLQMAPLRNESMLTAHPQNFRPSINRLLALRPKFVLVILPAGKIPLYAELKKECEVGHTGRPGLVTQCCSADRVLTAKQQYFANLIQKINTKTGGQNVTFADSILNAQPKLADKGTLFMGADVSHAPGHRAEVPSVAAVVGSFNVPVPTLYQAEVSAQKPRQERIQNLFIDGQWDAAHHCYAKPPGGAVRNLLNAFYAENRRPPKRIVFYRDGVSDGQFENVVTEEVDAIKKACKSIDPNFNPPLTFIVVQKRHHTRFYPDSPRDGDPKGNIRAGTVVDRDVSHPSLFDFYLCSHEGIQGTNRPVHYYVLYDENGFSPDEIQGLTNDLCYTYAACTRSISVAPPAYYADLAATRARLYMQEDWDSDSVSTSSGMAVRTRGGGIIRCHVSKTASRSAWCFADS